MLNILRSILGISPKRSPEPPGIKGFDGIKGLTSPIVQVVKPSTKVLFVNRNVIMLSPPKQLLATFPKADPCNLTFKSGSFSKSTSSLLIQIACLCKSVLFEDRNVVMTISPKDPQGPLTLERLPNLKPRMSSCFPYKVLYFLKHLILKHVKCLSKSFSVSRLTCAANCSSTVTAEVLKCSSVG